MTYSCSDFTDDIINALEIDIPEDSWDSPSDQADFALAEIERLRRIEKQLKHAIAVFTDKHDEALFVERVHVIATGELSA